MDTYTFGLRYAKHGGEVSEEIDVQANSFAEATELAIKLATEDYMPGWELVKLPTGGSGGWITIC
jgi:hypothetical protein